MSNLSLMYNTNYVFDLIPMSNISLIYNPKYLSDLIHLQSHVQRPFRVHV